MRIAILFDDVDSRSHATADERGVLEAVTAVEAVLRVLGHEALRVPAGPELEAWRDRLLSHRPDLVFNLCEGLGGQSEGEVLAARIVEEAGLRMTGSPAEVLALARRKDEVNTLLRQRGLPAPPWGVWNGFEREAWAARWTVFPAIVKPASEDASVGISQDSVVMDHTTLARQLGEMGELAPLLVQAFVGTREVNVGIVGDEVLPVAEIVFRELPTGHHAIVTYDAKWSPGSGEDLRTPSVCPAHLAPQVARRAQELALDAWRALGGKGYGRVDFRLDEPATFHVLEVNANPDLAPSAGLARMAQAQGWTYAALIDRIVGHATSVRETRELEGAGR